MASTFKVYTSQEIGTASEKVGNYTVAANTNTTVIGLTVANITNAPITGSAYITAGAEQTYIIKNALVPVGSSLIVVGGNQKLVLTPGYSVFVEASDEDSLDVIMSVLEVTG